MDAVFFSRLLESWQYGDIGGSVQGSGDKQQRWELRWRDGGATSLLTGGRLNGMPLIDNTTYEWSEADRIRSHGRLTQDVTWADN